MNHSINVVKALYNYCSCKTVCSNYPYVTNIEPTNACNLSCTFCAREAIRARGEGMMSMGTFWRIINTDNAPMIRSLCLTRNGEPLLNKNITAMVKIAAPIARSTSIYTNGTLLTPWLFRDLADAGLSNLVFSLEGDGSTYERLRRGSSYERVRSNILMARDIRRASGSGPELTIAAIRHPDTVAALPEFIKFWEGEGIEVKTMLLNDFGGAMGSEPCDPEYQEEVCFWPWFGLTVDWRGKVLPCCQFEVPDFDLGDVSRSSIAQIWNNRDYQDFRRRMLDGRDGLPCGRCAFASRSMTVPYHSIKRPGAVTFLRKMWNFAKFKGRGV